MLPKVFNKKVSAAFSKKMFHSCAPVRSQPGDAIWYFMTHFAPIFQLHIHNQRLNSLIIVSLLLFFTHSHKLSAMNSSAAAKNIPSSIRNKKWIEKENIRAILIEYGHNLWVGWSKSLGRVCIWNADLVKAKGIVSDGKIDIQLGFFVSITAETVVDKVSPFTPPLSTNCFWRATRVTHKKRISSPQTTTGACTCRSTAPACWPMSSRRLTVSCNSVCSPDRFNSCFG